MFFKLRIATAMYLHFFPILAITDFKRLKDGAEPVQSNYAREAVSWSAVNRLLLADCRN